MKNFVANSNINRSLALVFATFATLSTVFALCHASLLMVA